MQTCKSVHENIHYMRFKTCKGVTVSLFIIVFVFILFFRTVTESINQLITLCTQQAPGQKECDNALRELEVNLIVSDYLLVFQYYV